jgi:hypothetical protein
MQDIPRPFQRRASPHRGHVGESVVLLLSTLKVLRSYYIENVMREMK